MPPDPFNPFGGGRKPVGGVDRRPINPNLPRDSDAFALATGGGGRPLPGEEFRPIGGRGGGVPILGGFGGGPRPQPGSGFGRGPTPFPLPGGDFGRDSPILGGFGGGPRLGHGNGPLRIESPLNQGRNDPPAGTGGATSGNGGDIPTTGGGDGGGGGGGAPQTLAEFLASQGIGQDAGTDLDALRRQHAANVANNQRMLQQIQALGASDQILNPHAFLRKFRQREKQGFANAAQRQAFIDQLNRRQAGQRFSDTPAFLSNFGFDPGTQFNTQADFTAARLARLQDLINQFNTQNA